MRTVLLGLLGLALAVAVGFGVHLITRSTISLPVVQLEQPPPVPTRLTPTQRTPARTPARTTVTMERGTTTAELETEPETETEDSSGRGRSGGASGGDSGGNSGSGGGDD